MHSGDEYQRLLISFCSPELASYMSHTGLLLRPEQRL
uniref:Uncharacterized protein n=1 Tax=Anguilla anguilla TaxID=7936 RepID=A0A0E9SVA4_ANGAN